MSRHSPRIWGDRGSVAVEVAVVAPAFVFLMLLVTFAGRVAEAEANMTSAASEAARAASLRQHPADATTDAEAVVAVNLSAAGIDCVELIVAVDTGDFAPGGTVTVELSCTTSMADVTLLGVPGTRTFTSSATEVIDRYRGDGT